MLFSRPLASSCGSSLCSRPKSVNELLGKLGVVDRTKLSVCEVFRKTCLNKIFEKSRRAKIFSEHSQVASMVLSTTWAKRELIDKLRPRTWINFSPEKLMSLKRFWWERDFGITNFKICSKPLFLLYFRQLFHNHKLWLNIWPKKNLKNLLKS